MMVIRIMIMMYYDDDDDDDYNDIDNNDNNNDDDDNDYNNYSNNNNDNLDSDGNSHSDIVMTIIVMTTKGPNRHSDSLLTPPLTVSNWQDHLNKVQSCANTSGTCPVQDAACQAERWDSSAVT